MNFPIQIKPTDWKKPVTDEDILAAGKPDNGLPQSLSAGGDIDALLKSLSPQLSRYGNLRTQGLSAEYALSSPSVTQGRQKIKGTLENVMSTEFAGLDPGLRKIVRDYLEYSQTHKDSGEKIKPEESIGSLEDFRVPDTEVKAIKEMLAKRDVTKALEHLQMVKAKRTLASYSKGMAKKDGITDPVMQKTMALYDSLNAFTTGTNQKRDQFKAMAGQYIDGKRRELANSSKIILNDKGEIDRAATRKNITASMVGDSTAEFEGQGALTKKIESELTNRITKYNGGVRKFSKEGYADPYEILDSVIDMGDYARGKSYVQEVKQIGEERGAIALETARRTRYGNNPFNRDLAKSLGLKLKPGNDYELDTQSDSDEQDAAIQEFNAKAEKSPDNIRLRNGGWTTIEQADAMMRSFGLPELTPRKLSTFDLMMRSVKNMTPSAATSLAGTGVSPYDSPKPEGAHTDHFFDVRPLSPQDLHEIGVDISSYEGALLLDNPYFSSDNLGAVGTAMHSLSAKFNPATMLRQMSGVNNAQMSETDMAVEEGANALFQLLVGIPLSGVGAPATAAAKLAESALSKAARYVVAEGAIDGFDFVSAWDDMGLTDATEATAIGLISQFNPGTFFDKDADLSTKAVAAVTQGFMLIGGGINFTNAIHAAKAHKNYDSRFATDAADKFATLAKDMPEAYRAQAERMYQETFDALVKTHNVTDPKAKAEIHEIAFRMAFTTADTVGGANNWSVDALQSLNDVHFDVDRYTGKEGFGKNAQEAWNRARARWEQAGLGAWMKSPGAIRDMNNTLGALEGMFTPVQKVDLIAPVDEVVEPVEAETPEVATTEPVEPDAAETSPVEPTEVTSVDDAIDRLNAGEEITIDPKELPDEVVDGLEAMVESGEVEIDLNEDGTMQVSKPESAGESKTSVLPVSGVQTFNPDDIQVMPGFQYKSDIVDTDAQVTAKYKKVDTFNQSAAPPIGVWLSKEGKQFVFHGHHRRDIAKRATKFVKFDQGADGNIAPVDIERGIEGKIYREEDGWTKNMVRQLGALENLYAGTAKTYDTVMVLKELGMEPKDFKRYGISVTEGLGRNVEALLKVPDDALNFVRSGDLHEDFASGIASIESLDTPEKIQGAMAEAVASGESRRSFSEGQLFGQVFAANMVADDLDTKSEQGELIKVGKVARSSRSSQVDILGALKNRVDRDARQYLQGQKLTPIKGELIDAKQRQALLEKMGGNVKQALERTALIFGRDFEFMAKVKAQADLVATGNQSVQDAANNLYSELLEAIGRKQNDLIAGRQAPKRSDGATPTDEGTTPSGSDSEGDGTEQTPVEEEDLSGRGSKATGDSITQVTKAIKDAQLALKSGDKENVGMHLDLARLGLYEFSQNHSLPETMALLIDSQERAGITLWEMSGLSSDANLETLASEAQKVRDVLAGEQIEMGEGMFGLVWRNNDQASQRAYLETILKAMNDRGDADSLNPYDDSPTLFEVATKENVTTFKGNYGKVQVNFRVPLREGNTAGQDFHLKAGIAETIYRAEVSLLAAQALRQMGSVNTVKLIGQPVVTQRDLASLGQQLRSDHFEFLHHVYLKNGQIMEVETTTARLAGAVAPITGSVQGDSARIKEKIRLKGYDGVMLMHNHPQGTSNPGKADVDNTVKIAQELGDTFQGHIVLDHNEFSSISSDGSTKTDQIDSGLLKKADVAHPLLGLKLSDAGVYNPQSVVHLARNLIGSNTVHLVGVSNAGKVNGIYQMSQADLEMMITDPTRGAATLSRLGKELGAGQGLVVTVDDVLPHTEGFLRDMWEKDLVFDVVDAKGRTLFPEWSRGKSGPIRGEYRLGRDPQVTAEKQIAWASNSDSLVMRRLPQVKGYQEIGEILFESQRHWENVKGAWVIGTAMTPSSIEWTKGAHGIYIGNGHFAFPNTAEGRHAIIGLGLNYEPDMTDKYNATTTLEDKYDQMVAQGERVMEYSDTEQLAMPGFEDFAPPEATFQLYDTPKPGLNFIIDRKQGGFAVVGASPSVTKRIGSLSGARIQEGLGAVVPMDMLRDVFEMVKDKMTPEARTHVMTLMPSRSNEASLFESARSVLGPGPLVAVHKTNAVFLGFAATNGGLPAPSLAITKPHIVGSMGFGDVVLIPHHSKVDPAMPKNFVYSSDAYTPRANQKLTYEYRAENVKAMLEDLLEFIPEGYVKKGSIQANFVSRLGDALVRAGSVGTDGRLDWTATALDSPLMKFYYLSKQGKSISQIGFGRYLKSRAEAPLDVSKALEPYLNPDDALGFVSFVQGMADHIFGEGGVVVGGKRVPTTSENLTAAMLENEIKGGELEGKANTFEGVHVAALRRFGDYSDYRRDAGRLMEREQVGSSVNQWLTRTDKLMRTLEGKLSQDSTNMRPVYSAMRDYLRFTNRSEITAKIALGRAGFDIGKITETELTTFVQQAEKVTNLPTEYYEAKIADTVSLGFFDAAVVPIADEAKIRPLLEKMGVKNISTYDSLSFDSLDGAVNKHSDLFYSDQIQPQDDSGHPNYRIPPALVSPRLIADPIFGQVPLSHAEFFDLLDELFPNGPQTLANLRIKGAKGLYDATNKLKIVASDTFWRTAIHELAHQLDDENKIMLPFFTEWQKKQEEIEENIAILEDIDDLLVDPLAMDPRLMELDAPEFTQSINKIKRREMDARHVYVEVFAEWLASFTMNPSQTMALAPKFTQYALGQLAGGDKVLDALGFTTVVSGNEVKVDGKLQYETTIEKLGRLSYEMRVMAGADPGDAILAGVALNKDLLMQDTIRQQWGDRITEMVNQTKREFSNYDIDGQWKTSVQDQIRSIGTTDYWAPLETIIKEGFRRNGVNESVFIVTDKAVRKIEIPILHSGADKIRAWIEGQSQMPAGLTPDSNPLIYLRWIPYVDQLVDRSIRQGLMELDGTLTSHSPKKVFDLLDRSSKKAFQNDYRDLVKLLVSERHLEKMTQMYDAYEIDAAKVQIAMMVKQSEAIEAAEAQIGEELGRELQGAKGEIAKSTNEEISKVERNANLTREQKDAAIKTLIEKANKREAIVTKQLQTRFNSRAAFANARIVKTFDARTAKILNRKYQQFWTKTQRLFPMADVRGDANKSFVATYESLRADPKRFRRLLQAAKEYRAVGQWALKFLKDSGVISQDLVDLINRQNEFWFDAHRVFDEDSINKNLSSAGSPDNPIYKFNGSLKTIKDPMENLVSLVDTVYRVGLKNRVLDLTTDLFSESRRFWDSNEPMHTDVMIRVAEGVQRPKQSIKVYKNGEVVYYEIPDKGTYSAMQNIGSIPGGALRNHPIARFLTFLPRTMRNFIIYSPGFALRNILRDTQSRMIQSNTPGIIERWFESFEAAVADKKKEIEGEIKDIDLDQAVDLYGVGLGRLDIMADRDGWDKVVKNMSKDLVSRGYIVDKSRRLKLVWEELIEVAEKANRKAEFKNQYRHARTTLGFDEHNSKLFAAYMARTLLIDFRKASLLTKHLNMVEPFTNPAVQGISSTAAAFQRDPHGMIGRWIKYTILMIGLERLWAAYSNSEEEREKESAMVKDMHWIFDLSPMGVEGQNLAVPKPHEIGFASAVVNRAIDKAGGDEHAFDGIADRAVQLFSPYDASGFGGPVQDMRDLWTKNWDNFYNTSVVDPEEFANEYPVELRAGTVTASELGQKLQRAFPTDHQQDARIWDKTIEIQFGNYGKFMLDASDAVAGKKSWVDVLAKQTGLFRPDSGFGSPDVQWVLDTQKKYGGKYGGMNPLKNQLDNRYKAIGAENVAKADKALRVRAAEVRKQAEEAIASVKEGKDQVIDTNKLTPEVRASMQKMVSEGELEGSIDSKGIYTLKGKKGGGAEIRAKLKAMWQPLSPKAGLDDVLRRSQSQKRDRDIQAGKNVFENEGQ